jgi:hypothetical protein
MGANAVVDDDRPVERLEQRNEDRTRVIMEDRGSEPLVSLVKSAQHGPDRSDVFAVKIHMEERTGAVATSRGVRWTKPTTTASPWQQGSGGRGMKTPSRGIRRSLQSRQ